MLSASMLFIIFMEVSIAVVTVLGSILVASKYSKENNVQDLYVSLVLAFGASADLSMLFSQVAFSLQNPISSLGVKLFLISVLGCAFFVWFHMANIYSIRSKMITFLVFISSIYIICNVLFATVSQTLQEGVIVPRGDGREFLIGFLLIMLFVALESIYAVVGLKRVPPAMAERFHISKTAGALFLIFLICLTVYIFSRILIYYVFTWVFAFFAMLFLFLFSMITDGSLAVKVPLRFFRTRILFKLVITLVVIIMISLEGMGIISINIAKKALSETVIEGYRNVAEDTVRVINSTRIDTSSEQATLKTIARILGTTKIGARGSVFLVSPSKNVYMNRANIWISLGESDAFEIQKALLPEKRGGEISIFGEKAIAAYIPIKKLGWNIIVGQPINFAYDRIRQMEGTFILFILLWITLTVIVGIVFAKNIEDPIKEVKKGIIKIAEGDLDYKININNIDEIGELASTFNKMTTELKESQESLIRAERLSSLGYMAAGMAHEIKNALVPLKTLTELLVATGGDKAFLTKFNELVPKEIDRISKLSNDLLHYSRPIEPVFEFIDVNDIIEESAKFLDMQARKRSVIIKRNLLAISNVKADKQKLIEVFTNLILNAIEAMNGGEIWLSSYDRDDKVVVEIADNGPGIPEENIKKIFVPFFTTKKEGTGMGLAITQRVIADHGGSIDIKSKPGEGTTFFLIFPQKS
jgi:signal transduction histidine kinase